MRSRLSVPAANERLHSGLPCCLISLRRCAVLVAPEGQRPHPLASPLERREPSGCDRRPRYRQAHRNRHRLERRRDSLELVGVRGRSPSPILLGFSLHRRRIRVFHLQPIGRSAAAVRRVFPFRYDALQPHFASVGKEIAAVQLDQADWARLGRSGGDPSFFFRR
jgi:hypothetical protein